MSQDEVPYLVCLNILPSALYRDGSDNPNRLMSGTRSRAKLNDIEFEHAIGARWCWQIVALNAKGWGVGGLAQRH
jgi:hypothetical protein